MKKTILTKCLLLSCFAAMSQSYNVPYKHQNKFILINNNGVQVLDNQYDQIQWLSDKYLMGTNKINSDEPLVVGNQTYMRGSDGVLETDLIRDNKVIISKSPFQNFVINDIGIISAASGSYFTIKDKASIDKYQITEDERIVLFNTKGKQIYKKAINDFDVMLPMVHKLDTMHYLMFLKTSAKQYDVCVYDKSKQEIVQTILNNVNHLRLQKSDVQNGTYAIRYEDAAKKTIDKIYIYNGKALVAKTENTKINPLEKEMPSRVYEEEARYVDVFSNDVKAREPLDDNERVVLTPVAVKRDKNYYYKILNDTVYVYPEFFTFKTAKFVGVNTATTIYKNPIVHSPQGIVKCEQGRCEILTPTKSTGGIYTDADYIGINYFLVKNENHKYGIIDKKLATLVPTEYDSIQINAMKISDGAIGVNIYGRSKYEKPLMNFTESHNFAYAYKAGKVQVYKNNFEPLFTDWFDAFYKNVAHSMDDLSAKNQDYIAVKGSDYYVATYNEQQKKFALIGPFEGYPLYAYKDYFGVKGLNLYLIHDKSFRFVGLAEPNAKVVKLK
jgi:hypothetical protein